MALPRAALAPLRRGPPPRGAAGCVAGGRGGGLAADAAGAARLLCRHGPHHVPWTMGISWGWLGCAWGTLGGWGLQMGWGWRRWVGELGLMDDWGVWEAGLVSIQPAAPTTRKKRTGWCFAMEVMCQCLDDHFEPSNH